MVKEHRCHLLAEQYNGQQDNQQNIAIYFDSEAGSWQMMISRLVTNVDLEEKSLSSRDWRAYLSDDFARFLLPLLWRQVK